MISNKQAAVIIDMKPDMDSPHAHIKLCREIFINSFGQNCPNLLCLEIPVDESGKGNIKYLENALMQCLQIRPSVVSMSIGSVCLSDAHIIYPVLQELLHKGTHIVAALSNSGYITFPASMQDIIGVIADDVPPSDKPAVYRAEKNTWGVDLIAGYFSLPSKAGRDTGNSLAAPVVAGLLYSDMYIEGVFEKEAWIANFPQKHSVWLQKKTENVIIEFKQKPLVLLQKLNIGIDELEKGFSYLKEQHDVEAILYTKKKNFHKACFRCIEYAVTTAELLFLDESYQYDEEVDIIVNRTKDNTIYFWENNQRVFNECQKFERIIDELLLIL